VPAWTYGSAFQSARTGKLYDFPDDIRQYFPGIADTAT
jgi:hypothetical protein